MSIKGDLQVNSVNDYGYPRIKVAGVWYGADKKGDIKHLAIETMVEFETFKNAKGYDTFKIASIKAYDGPVSVPAKAAPKAFTTAYKVTGGKDTYWADKEARDVSKEPKIAYFAAFERALLFVTLAHTTGALSALAKAKDSSKLDILLALVDEQTQRIFDASYAQETAGKNKARAVEVETAKEIATEADNSDTWA